jgi:hypothetical protein
VTILFSYAKSIPYYCFIKGDHDASCNGLDGGLRFLDITGSVLFQAIAISYKNTIIAAI